MAVEPVTWVEPGIHTAPPPSENRRRAAVEVAEYPELTPLPPDPLDAVSPPHESEPPWLRAWLEEQGEFPAGECRPDHLSSEVLAAAEPGPFLAAELEGTALRDVDEYHLVELIAGYHRMAAWAHARMAQVAADLSRRPALNPRGTLPTGEYVMNVTGEELAPRLGLSRFAAKRIVENGRLFSLKLEDTGRALEQGLIDYPKACAVARLLKDQPDDVAWEVQQIVLPEAPHLTITQLEKAISKAIISIDPLRATARHQTAREQRRVHHPRPLPDGMASMFAVLPATDAAGLDLALEAAARAARAAGDTRTIDQLRADALALLGNGALERGFIGCPHTQQQDDVDAGHSPAAHDAGQPGHTGPGAGDDERADPEPSQPAPENPSSGSGDAEDHSPGGSGGAATASSTEGAPDLGPADADDEVSAALSGGGVPAFQTGNSFLRTPCMPLGLIGGRRAQINVTVPLSVLFPFQSLDDKNRCEGDSRAHGQPGALPPGPGGSAPGRCNGNGLAHGQPGALPPGPGGSAPGRCDGDSPAHGQPGAPPPGPGGSPPGRCDGSRCPQSAGAETEPGYGFPEDWYHGAPVEVAELAGYGPITPDVARGLAHSGGTWRRLVTDPLSGELLDVGRTRYRPPAPIADFVRLRDGSCVRPGCSSPAHAAQLDHVVPWEFGGVTSADNLGSLCPADHPTKTVGAFRLRHLGGGSFEWITPTGHRYVRHHSGRITALGRERAGGDPGLGDQPPF